MRYLNWTWAKMREQVQIWGSIYDLYREEMPIDITVLSTFEDEERRMQEIAVHLHAALNTLENRSDIPFGIKIAAHRALYFGLNEDTAPSKCSVWLDWDYKTNQYRVGLCNFGEDETMYADLDDIIEYVHKLLMKLQNRKNKSNH